MKITGVQYVDKGKEREYFAVLGPEGLVKLKGRWEQRGGTLLKYVDTSLPPGRYVIIGKRGPRGREALAARFEVEPGNGEAELKLGVARLRLSACKIIKALEVPA